MKDTIKSLKDLGLEIAQSNETKTHAWLKMTAKLYEQLLLADYLEKRKASLHSLEEKLIEKISELQENAPIELKQAERNIKPLGNFGDEIRKLDIPQGPPVSNFKESIYTQPTAKPKSEEVEEREMEIEETTVETTFEVEVPPLASKTVEKISVEKSIEKISIAERAATKPKKSLNDSLSGSSLKFGLNDRIAFVKHLFNGSQEDFNRVVSQLNTFSSRQEALDFINHIVRPEYNWKSKEEFAERFMESLENRFA